MTTDRHPAASRWLLPRGEMTAERPLGAAAVLAFGVFSATVLAMPYLKDNYSPIDDAISQGAIGKYGLLQVAGFFSLGAGSLCVSSLLHRAKTGRWPVTLTTVLVAISAMSVIGVGVFTTDPPDAARSTEGSIHLAVATAAFLTNIAGMIWSGYAFRADQRLKSLASPSLLLGLAALVLLVATGTNVGPTGLVQRGTVACELVWLTLVALRLARPEDGSGIGR